MEILANGRDWPTQKDANNAALFPFCGDTTRQSPINIVTASAVQRTVGPIVFSPDYMTKKIQMHWTNTGHDGAKHLLKQFQATKCIAFASFPI